MTFFLEPDLCVSLGLFLVRVCQKPRQAAAKKTDVVAAAVLSEVGGIFFASDGEHSTEVKAFLGEREVFALAGVKLILPPIGGMSCCFLALLVVKH